jgi:hypothetical protein
VVTTVCFLPLHTGCGCGGHPAFPCALDFMGGCCYKNSDASCRENTESHSTSFRGARSANYDAQLRIGESRDSGSGPSDHPGMTGSASQGVIARSTCDDLSAVALAEAEAIQSLLVALDCFANARNDAGSFAGIFSGIQDQIGAWRWLREAGLHFGGVSPRYAPQESASCKRRMDDDQTSNMRLRTAECELQSRTRKSFPVPLPRMPEADGQHLWCCRILPPSRCRTGRASKAIYPPRR